MILLATALLTLLGIVASTAWLSEKSNGYFVDSVRSRTLRASAAELRSALQSAESSQRGYLVSGNEIYLAPYDAAKAQTRSQFERLKQYMEPLPRSGIILARLSTAVAEKIAEMDSTISLKSESRDADSAAVFRSNRGKALMDEISLFLSSIIRQMDEQLATSMNDQQRNANWLRLTTVIGGLVIVLVVGAATALVVRYAYEVSQARNALNAFNLTLEDRVASRTKLLSEERDRAELLVAEINHRVANSLALVASLVRLQSNVISDDASKQALKETEARILAVASVHKRLYSSGDARFVDLQEYLSSLLENVQGSMHGQGHLASLSYDLEPVKLKTDFSINLGVIVTEWVTNAVKYAYPEGRGEVRIRLRKLDDDKAELLVEDDGVGRAGKPTKGTGLGTRIVNAMARSIGGDVEYLAVSRGTIARLAFSPAFEG